MAAFICNIKTVFIKLLVVPLLFLCMGAFAQDNFKGLLINKLDSSFVPFATIFLKEPGINIVTDNQGQFSCAIPTDMKQVTMTIAAIGCKTTIVYHIAFTNPEKIYVELIPGSLNEVTVVGAAATAVPPGITPAEVVKRAVEAIPQNYMDESYYSLSFYRQYQCVNNRFMNLIEAQPMVLFSLSEKKGMIRSKESFLVDDMRKTSYLPYPDEMSGNFIAGHLTENPIYHLNYSSIDPSRLANYTYRFDTAPGVSADYVVSYISPHYSSEYHGVSIYASLDFRGESWEEGRLVIDKKTYAIKKYSRMCYRYPQYKYPKHNNLLQPRRDYAIEFVKAQMDVYYVLFEGKWYVKQLLHKYTNEFFKTQVRTKAYTITSAFEWYSTGIVDKKTSKINDKFQSVMPDEMNVYDPARWKGVIFPFYFDSTNIVYRDLLRTGDLDNQFRKESLR